MAAQSGPPSDEELTLLMTAYQGGELQAFEEIYQRLQPALRKYLISLTLDLSRAEDLLQETFLQIHRSRHTYMAPRPVQPWAFGVARHVFLMDRRTRARRGRFELTPGEDLPEVPVPSIDASFGRHDQVRKAVAQLPEDGREALLLHHVWGFSFREIGGMIGIREVTAKVRSHRAMARLRGMLLGEDGAEGQKDARATGNRITKRRQA